MIFSWVKYGVGAIIIICGAASIGAMVVGKFAQMGRVGQMGAGGLAISLLGAILYVAIYGILIAIVGNGC